MIRIYSNRPSTLGDSRGPSGHMTTTTSGCNRDWRARLAKSAGHHDLRHAPNQYPYHRQSRRSTSVITDANQGPTSKGGGKWLMVLLLRYWISAKNKRSQIAVQSVVIITRNDMSLTNDSAMKSYRRRYEPFATLPYRDVLHSRKR